MDLCRSDPGRTHEITEKRWKKEPCDTWITSEESDNRRRYRRMYESSLAEEARLTIPGYTCRSRRARWSREKSASVKPEHERLLTRGGTRASRRKTDQRARPFGLAERVMHSGGASRGPSGVTRSRENRSPKGVLRGAKIHRDDDLCPTRARTCRGATGGEEYGNAREDLSLAGWVLHAYAKGKESGRICVPLLPLRHSPAGKEPSQQARGFIPKEPPRRGRKVHVALYRGCSLVALSAQPARAYTLARCLSLSLSVSAPLSFSFSCRLSPSVSRARERNALRHFARLAGWLAGWIRWPDSRLFLLAGWSTGWPDPLAVSGRGVFPSSRGSCRDAVAVSVAAATPRLAPSRSLARTRKRRAHTPPLYSAIKHGHPRPATRVPCRQDRQRETERESERTEERRGCDVRTSVDVDVPDGGDPTTVRTYD